MKKTLALILGMMLLAAATSCAYGAEIETTPPDTTAQDTSADQSEPEGLVLVDGNHITVTALGIEKTEGSSGLKLEIVNNSGKKIKVGYGYDGVEYVSVNGYAVKYEDSLTIEAGEAVDVTVGFTDEQLALYGIGEISEVELGFTVTEDGVATYIAPVVYTEVSSDSENFYADGFQVDLAGEETVFSTGSLDIWVPIGLSGVNVLNEYLVIGENGHRTLYMELENTTDSLAYVDVENWEINGISLKEYAGEIDVCPAGKRVILAYDLDTAFGDVPLSAIGVDDLNRIAADFTVGFDKDDNGEIDSNESAAVDIRLDGWDNIKDPEGAELYDGKLLRVISRAVVKIDNADGYSYGTAVLIENSTGLPIDINTADVALKVNGREVKCATHGCYIENNSIGALTLLFTDMELNEGETNEIVISYTIKDRDGNVIANQDGLTLELAL